MIRKIVPLILFFTFIYSFLISHPVNASWDSAKDGDKIILIRHAKAPGFGDP